MAIIKICDHCKIPDSKINSFEVYVATLSHDAECDEGTRRPYKFVICAKCWDDLKEWIFGNTYDIDSRVRDYQSRLDELEQDVADLTQESIDRMSSDLASKLNE